ncbi:tetratricopeptide repeat protein [Tenacibaculum pacificus]|uniref:tetratricopeptide repeat protein n=1 Tax=Tenacibaculum pacificus TaxID=3018314 RepID=UPI0022F3D64D|nr:tetratricopeptide repeat protein [Tenacibaculum pacificus]WBX74769.1 tetratricopeptide repeat protein [Tenacibaculum pacificus]
MLNQLGVAYRRQDKVRLALNYHQEVLDIISKIEKQKIDIKVIHSVAINSIGNIYLALKQYERALDKFKESLAIQEQLEDLRGIAINHQNIGFAHKNIGNLDIALDNFQKSLKYNELNKDKLGKLICHNSIANVLIIKGKYKIAYRYIIEVVSLAEKIGNRYYLSEVYNTLGWVFLKLKKYKKSKYYLGKSLKISVENDISSSLIICYQHLSELNKKKKTINRH